MIKYVKKPLLPTDCSDIVISGRYYAFFENILKKLGIRAFLLSDNRQLPKETAHHTDLSVFHAGGNQIYISQYYKDSPFSERLHGAGFEIRYFEKALSEKYPDDAGGNVCYFGKCAVLNTRTADPVIRKYLDSCGAVQIDVRQGYTKCNICVIDDQSIITNDRIISVKAKQAGMDVLLSDPTYIRLEGFQHGFIGGSTFKATADKLCFTGVLDCFPEIEKKRILDFLDKKGIEPVFLSEFPLFDIGGAVPLLEK